MPKGTPKEDIKEAQAPEEQKQNTQRQPLTQEEKLNLALSREIDISRETINRTLNSMIHNIINIMKETQQPTNG